MSILILDLVCGYATNGYVSMESIPQRARTRDKVEKRYGLYAKNYLKEFLGKTSTLRTQKDGKGKFGRILGSFIVYDPATDSYRSVNDMMIENHIGVAYHGQSKDDIEGEHLRNRELLAEKGINP